MALDTRLGLLHVINGAVDSFRIVLEGLVLETRAAVKLGKLSGGRRLKVLLALAAEELVHGLDGQNRSLVMNGGSLVRLVHGDGSVHDLGLDRLLLDDGLDVVVNVVVGALAGHDAGGRRAVLGVVHLSLTGVLGLVVLEGSAGLSRIGVVDILFVNGNEVVSVLLRSGAVSKWPGLGSKVLHIQLLLDREGLDDSLVVILVNLLVDGRGYVLMLLRANLLLDNRVADILVDGGVVLAVLGKEVGNGLLSFLHFE